MFDNVSASAQCLHEAIVDIQLSVIMKAKTYTKKGMIAGTAIGNSKKKEDGEAKQKRGTVVVVW